MSDYGNYEQILYEWLTGFVDKNDDGNPLVFRNDAPTLEEVQSFGNKVYCVYSIFEGAFGQQTTQPVMLYSYGSQKNVFDKKELMSKALLNNAVLINGDKIKVKLTSGNPFIQDKTDSDENIKGYYVNIIATVYKV